jgi:hypothetical protein
MRKILTVSLDKISYCFEKIKLEINLKYLVNQEISILIEKVFGD